MKLHEWQRSKLFGVWGKARRANGWLGKTVGNLDWRTRGHSGIHDQLYQLAIARRKRSSALPLTVDELRHAAIWMATKDSRDPTASLTTLDRSEGFERVWTLFTVLEDPDYFGSTFLRGPRDQPGVSTWDQFQQVDRERANGVHWLELSESPGELRRLNWKIGQAQRNYVLAVCADKFDVGDPRNLDLRQRRELVMTLDNRARAYGRPQRPRARRREPELELAAVGDDNQPF